MKFWHENCQYVGEDGKYDAQGIAEETEFGTILI